MIRVIARVNIPEIDLEQLPAVVRAIQASVKDISGATVEVQTTQPTPIR